MLPLTRDEVRRIAAVAELPDLRAARVEDLRLFPAHRRRPHPPVRRRHLNSSVGFRRDPAADNPTTRKSNGMRAVGVNDG